MTTCIICREIEGELAGIATHLDHEIGLVCRECSAFLRRRVAPAMRGTPGIADCGLAAPRNNRRPAK